MKHLESAVLYTDTICQSAVLMALVCLAVGFSLNSRTSIVLAQHITKSWEIEEDGLFSPQSVLDCSNTGFSAAQPSPCGRRRNLYTRLTPWRAE
jgi:hypothetical protein